MLEERRYRSAGELAEAEALDIVEAIMEGRQPKAMQLEELTDAIPSDWEKQRRVFCQAPPKRVEAGPLLANKRGRK